MVSARVAMGGRASAWKGSRRSVIAPLQGWHFRRVSVPRALPWAKLFRPVGALYALLDQALKGRHIIAQGNALGPGQIKSSKPCKGEIMRCHDYRATPGAIPLLPPRVQNATFYGG